MSKEVNKLSTVDSAYIAGLIDGEGTVTLSRRHRTENRHLVVSISNTERPLLEYVLNAVGAGKLTNKKTYRANHSSSFVYSISNRQALDLLKQLQPYLETYKAKRAEIILREYILLTPRNGFYSAEIKQARDDFVLKVLQIKPS